MKRVNTFVSVLVAVFGFLLAITASAPVFAHAGISDPALIHACVKKGKLVRIVSPNARRCKRGTGRPIHWSVTGPLGAQGFAGTPGPAGVPGQDGATGATGPQGTQGPQGEQGLPGTDGQNGATGPAGPQGRAGTPGQNGLDGAPGQNGEQGPKGDPGANGANGLDGAPGQQGDTGQPGAPGANGHDGAPGQNGEQGPKGDTGQPGAPGANGHDGAPGQNGQQGPKGDKGDRGSSVVSHLFRSTPVLNLDGTDDGTSRFEFDLAFRRPGQGSVTEENLFTQSLMFGEDLDFQVKLEARHFTNPGHQVTDCGPDGCRIRVVAFEVDTLAREVLGCYMLDPNGNNGGIAEVVSDGIGTVTGNANATLVAPTVAGTYYLLLDATDKVTDTCTSAGDWHTLDVSHDAVGVLSIN